LTLLCWVDWYGRSCVWEHHQTSWLLMRLQNKILVVGRSSSKYRDIWCDDSRCHLLVVIYTHQKWNKMPWRRTQSWFLNSALGLPAYRSLLPRSPSQLGIGTDKSCSQLGIGTKKPSPHKQSPVINTMPDFKRITRQAGSMKCWYWKKIYHVRPHTILLRIVTSSFDRRFLVCGSLANRYHLHDYKILWYFISWTTMRRISYSTACSLYNFFKLILLWIFHLYHDRNNFI